jgi:sugar lactone lactonase YvrE
MNVTRNRRRPLASDVREHSRVLRSTVAALLAGAGVLLGGIAGAADCEVVASGLRAPIGSAFTNQGNLVVSETGTANVPASGRVSIVSPDGGRRTLLDGLPQGTNAAGGDASGPNSLAMRGRTIYVAIGQGDTVIPGPGGSTIPNPNVSSALFSSVLAIHLSAAAERSTAGFTLSEQNRMTLAGGGKVMLSNGKGDKLQVELVVNFPDYVSEPNAANAGNVRNSNPFGVLLVDEFMYVTNGGLNRLYKVNLDTGSYAELAAFSPIANTSGLGGPPVVEAVPTGLAYTDGQVLVSLLSGGPFIPGLSRVKTVDPVTGAQSDFLTGLRTSIDVLPIVDDGDTDYLTLQNNFAPAPPWPPTGASVRRFEEAGSSSVVVSGCTLYRPTSMSIEPRTGMLYATELLNGTVVKVPLN